MLLKIISKQKKHIYCALVGIYLALLLWITLFSRIGDGNRGFLFPLYSYIEIIKGNKDFLVENFENVLLFIPFGIAIRANRKWRFKGSIKLGFCLSLLIELIQVIFALGTFECDDLIHNTVGVIIGYWIVEKLGIRVRVSRKHIKVLLIAFILAMFLPFGYQMVHFYHMVELAAAYDKDDGSKNLLILNGNSGYLSNTSMYVESLNDGRIKINGTADIEAWWLIADITLDSGQYIGMGLDDNADELLGIELAYFNKYTKRFDLLAQDIGSKNIVEFELERTVRVRAYVHAYPGANADCIVTPVIYKEE